MIQSCEIWCYDTGGLVVLMVGVCDDFMLGVRHITLTHKPVCMAGLCSGAVGISTHEALNGVPSFAFV